METSNGPKTNNEILADHLKSLNPELTAESFKGSFISHCFRFDSNSPFFTNGSVAVVITGKNDVDGTTKAIKCMRITTSGSVRTYKEEARLFSGLDCVNIVRFFWVWKDELKDEKQTKLFCISMDYCQTNLEKLILSKHFDQPEIIGFCQDLANGLAYLHGARNTSTTEGATEAYKRLIHRDFKPENILVKQSLEGHSTKYVLKIADFGLSRTIQVDEGQVYTPMEGYKFLKAPELGDSAEKDFREDQAYTELVDCFALGKIIMLMLFFNVKYSNESYQVNKDKYDNIMNDKNDGKVIWMYMDDATEYVKELNLYKKVVCRLIETDPNKRLSAGEATKLLSMDKTIHE